jgi:PPOX class probable F420-dependent enzyme
MAGRRDLIRMTEGELRDYLAGSKTIILTSNGANGYPHPMPMWFSIDEDGAIRMTTFRKSQKVLNIRRDPRVSLLVESGLEYSELRGVVIYGKAEVIDDLETVQDTLVRAATRQAPVDDPEKLEAMKQGMAATAAKRVCIRVPRERVVSWDHRKLGGRY